MNEVASVGGLRETEGSVFIDFIGVPTGFEPVSQPVKRAASRGSSPRFTSAAIKPKRCHKVSFSWKRALQNVMSALRLKADICGAQVHVCFGPIADMLNTDA